MRTRRRSRMAARIPALKRVAVMTNHIRHHGDVVDDYSKPFLKIRSLSVIVI